MYIFCVCDTIFIYVKEVIIKKKKGKRVTEESIRLAQENDNREYTADDILETLIEIQENDEEKGEE